jgi:hypothetical protein
VTTIVSLIGVKSSQPEPCVRSRSGRLAKTIACLGRGAVDGLKVPPVAREGPPPSDSLEDVD